MKALSNLNFIFYPELVFEPSNQIIEAAVVRNRRSVPQFVKLKLTVEDLNFDVAFNTDKFNNVRNLDVGYCETMIRNSLTETIRRILPVQYSDGEPLPADTEAQLVEFFNSASKVLLAFGHVSAKCTMDYDLVFTLEAEISNVPTCPYAKPLLEFVTEDFKDPGEASAVNVICIDIGLTEEALSKGYLFTGGTADSVYYTVDDYLSHMKWGSLATGLHELILEGRIDITNSKETPDSTAMLSEFYSEFIEALREIKHSMINSTDDSEEIVVSTELLTIKIN